MKRTLFVTAALCAAAIASAQLTQVATRGGLPANDLIDHGQLGASGTFVNSPALETSSLGINALVGMADGAQMQRLDEGNGWDGVFNPGDHLLFTNYDASNMVIALDQSTDCFGVQIQSNDFGSYTGSMSVYDGLGNLLGTFTASSNNTGAEDNSAAFLGVTSTRDNIAKVVLNTTNNADGYAINQISLCNCTPTPEPGALLALGLGLGGLLLRRRSA